MALAAAASAAATAAPSPSSRAGIYCGADASSPRRSAQTLTDRNAARIVWTPRRATVSQLRRLSRPPSITELTPRGPLERRVFTVRARLVRFQLKNDNDYRLVIADPRDAGRTMLASLPSTDCTVGARPRFAMALARRAFERECIDARRPVLVTITGVLLFDPQPLPRHSAPNGAELRPLVAFSGSC